MIYQATQSIYNTLRQVDGLKVFTEESDKNSRVWLQFGFDNSNASYRIQFISKDNDNDVSLRVFSIVNVPAAKRSGMLMTLNEINNKYRFFKFALDSDGDVNMEYDFFVRSNASACAVEAVIRINDILKDVYPMLMKALWA